MNRLPPQRIAQGEPFAYDVTVTGQDWTGYTGTAKYKTRPKAVSRTIWPFFQEAEPILEVEAIGDIDGLVQFGLSATDTAKLPALPRLGYFKTCVCEIAMTNASTGDVKRFQANVSVAAQI
jgi:hypothetical protein